MSVLTSLFSLISFKSENSLHSAYFFCSGKRDRRLLFYSPFRQTSHNKVTQDSKSQGSSRKQPHLRRRSDKTVGKVTDTELGRLKMLLPRDHAEVILSP
jgi:hypothetical protein